MCCDIIVVIVYIVHDKWRVTEVITKVYDAVCEVVGRSDTLTLESASTRNQCSQCTLVHMYRASVFRRRRCNFAHCLLSRAACLARQTERAHTLLRNCPGGPKCGAQGKCLAGPSVVMAKVAGDCASVVLQYCCNAALAHTQPWHLSPPCKVTTRCTVCTAGAQHRCPCTLPHMHHRVCEDQVQISATIVTMLHSADRQWCMRRCTVNRGC